MRAYRVVLLCFVVAACLPGSGVANADVVWLADGQTVYGQIVRENNGSIVMLSEGETRNYDRPSVIDYLVTVEPDRLKSLGAQGWSRYRDLAEELATLKKDIYAQEVAIRLLLIAAKNGDQRLKESCLRALSKLGRTDAERNKIDQFCRQQLGLREREPSGSLQENKSGGVTDRDRGELLKILRQIRQGNGSLAQQALRGSAVQKAVALIGDVCSADELMSFSRLNRLSLVQLSQLIRAESILRGLDLEPSSAKSSDPNWDQLAVKACDYPVKFPALEDLTEFDLRKFVYRDGRWRRPDGN